TYAVSFSVIRILRLIKWIYLIKLLQPQICINYWQHLEKFAGQLRCFLAGFLIKFDDDIWYLKV
ncbi:hypothetical protein, partial [Microcoleus anatoxicus]